MRQDDQYYTDLDIKLRDLAVNDWVTFYKLIGKDAIMAAKICMLRKQNKSLGQIQAKLEVSRMQVRYNSKEDHCRCEKTERRE